jgi:hypothetical protein
MENGIRPARYTSGAEKLPRAKKKCGGNSAEVDYIRRLLDVLANRSGTKSGAEFLHTLCTARRLIING